MSNLNVCEGVLVERYGDDVVIDIIAALAAAAETVQKGREIFALGATVTSGMELAGVS